MNWKKRGKKGWLGKKTAKEISKGSERQYGEREIKQQLQEDLEGDDFRYKGGKKKKNEIARLEYLRDLYQRWVDEDRKSSYNSPGYYKTMVKKYQKKIYELKKTM